ncbi:DUF11 domain-containing protein [Novosphingobium sp. Gsoil 351]|uniref:DUF11 domain-containing protein n=1 Tax=Novosphingobium sp. Gsoil 351 TaxID=2675225 RepID=UPI001E43BB30|nr:DUF11 domain-containing protein [Novosphingobium sp. Gsoil 351]
MGASAAHAAGVVAGTQIANTATATYDSGAASVSIQSNTVTVRVDELLNVAVTSLSANPTAAAAGTTVLTYRVTNTGNGPEAFDLGADPAISGNGFDPGVQSIAYDTNGNGVYDAGTDVILATGAPTAALAPDTSLTVFVLTTLPGSATDGQTGQVRLSATAKTGSGTPGTVFSGQGDGGGDAVVGTSTALDDALATEIARLATVNLTKSATILDPYGTQQPVPGAVVTYSLLATVSGAGAAGNLNVTDAIPAGTTYQPGTLTLDGAPLSDSTDGDAGQASPAGIAVGIGTLAGGSAKTVAFKVRIN